MNNFTQKFIFLSTVIQNSQQSEHTIAFISSDYRGYTVFNYGLSLKKNKKKEIRGRSCDSLPIAHFNLIYHNDAAFC